jgi:hypothetical protein
MYLTFGFLLKELLLCTKSLFVSFEFAYLTMKLFNLLYLIFELFLKIFDSHCIVCALCQCISGLLKMGCLKKRRNSNYYEGVWRYQS